MIHQAHLPIIAVLFAIAVLSGMDAIIKAMSAMFATWQIVLARYSFGALTAFPFAAKHLMSGISATDLRANVFRGVVIVFTAATFFYALGQLPIAEVVMIAFTAPLWTSVIARLVLGEPLTSRSLSAIAVGFAGVAYVVAPRLTGFNGPGEITGALGAISASFGYAYFVVLLRQQSASNPPAVLVFLQSITAFAVALPFALLDWTWPSVTQWLIFFVMGSIGTVGHLCLSWAFARAPAGHLAPLEYTSLLWAVLFGYFFFEETPSERLLVGGLLIVAACVIIAARPRTGRVVQDKA